MEKYRHYPVLVREVIEYLKIVPGKNYIDATLGGGGHAEKILAVNGPVGKVLGIDLDEKAIALARQRLKKYTKRFFFAKGNYKNIKEIVSSLNFGKVDGILLDLGLSSYQLEESGRGFSYQREERLDMRFDDQDSGQAAVDILNEYEAFALEQLFQKYGEERNARRIASNIVAARKQRSLSRTSELLKIIRSSIPARFDANKTAGRVFQALRIEVNKELENLSAGLAAAVDVLAPEGRLVVISYHSLEDRIVKNYFRQEAKDCVCPPEIPICQCGHYKKLKILTPKPVTPDPQEIKENSRSRSAKMRVAEKIKNQWQNM